MKAILKFDLPTEHSDFMAAVEATETLSGLHDLRNKVRSRLKHGPAPDEAFVDEIYQDLIDLTPDI